MKAIFSALMILAAAIAGVKILAVSSPDYQQQEKHPAGYNLECHRYEKPELYLMCEQAKAAKDMAETMKRIEKKIPNFNEFND